MWRTEIVASLAMASPVEVQPGSSQDLEFTQNQEESTPLPPVETIPHPFLWGRLDRYSTADTSIPHARYDLKIGCSVVSIGGDPTKDVDILIKGTRSRLHAKIRRLEMVDGISQVVIEDYSTFGTFVGRDNHKLSKGERMNLKDYDEIAFGYQLPKKRGSTYCEHRLIYRDLASPLVGVKIDYTFEETLGEGTFGIVRKAVHRNGQYFAIKTIAHPTVVAEEDRQKVNNEIDLMGAAKHPNVCSLVEYFWNADDSVDLVLEYVAGGDLVTLIQKQSCLDEETTKCFMKQLCEALNHIHSIDICHRDLKPENLLLTDDQPPILKIADFGLAKFAGREKLMTICGTLIYMAPEVLSGSGYSFSADCYSTGCVVIACLTGKDPSTETVKFSRLRAKVKNKELSAAGFGFIQKLVQIDPNDRLTMPQALEHYWFKVDSSAANKDYDELSSSFRQVSVRDSTDTAESTSYTTSGSKRKHLELTATSQDSAVGPSDIMPSRSTTSASPEPAKKRVKSVEL
ncbi:kinase-like domain-containing protein [Favolaschia claudopus]|uniref:Kinase-like domain-containing protein n=1 Tax=Favolaschia claudopus TaxID=2862362 RepID=A0AAW0DWD5_9AGAR